MYDYTILGAGAVGSVFGGRLAAAGFSVELITRGAALGKAIADHGLRLELDQGMICTHPHAATPADAAPTRCVMIFTKTHQTQDAMRGIARILTPQTTVVTLQNGLGNGAHVAAGTAGEVYEGVTMLPATLLAPGHIRSHGAHQTWIGPCGDAATEGAARIARDLRKAGFDMVECAVPAAPIWQKAAFNVAMNALAALTTGAPGLIGQTPGLTDLAHGLADEALSVARAEGIPVNEAKVHELITFAVEGHPYHKPSMLQDIEAGRMTEIDALNGHVVFLADRHDIDVPLNRTITALVRGRQTADTFWDQAPL